MTLGHDPLGSSKAQPLTLPTATAMPGSTGERVDRLERELEKAHDSLDGINTFTKDVAKLDVQTAQSQGIETAEKLACFLREGRLDLRPVDGTVGKVGGKLQGPDGPAPGGPRRGSCSWRREG